MPTGAGWGVDVGLRATLWWDERGIVLRASRRALLLGDPWERQTMSTVTLRWQRVHRVTPCMLWPDFVIDARERGIGPARYAIPLSRLVDADDVSRDQVAAYADAFADTLAERGLSEPLAQGWSAAPDVAWEDARCLPHRTLPRAEGGPFRTAVAPHDRVVALWEEPPLVGLGALLVRSERPTAYVIEAPTAVAFTDEHVYASAGGFDFRVSLATLRAVCEHRGAGGPPYPLRLVFGRRCELRLSRQASRALRATIEARFPPYDWHVSVTR